MIHTYVFTHTHMRKEHITQRRSQVPPWCLLSNCPTFRHKLPQDGTVGQRFFYKHWLFFFFWSVWHFLSLSSTHGTSTLSYSVIQTGTLVPWDLSGHLMEAARLNAVLTPSDWRVRRRQHRLGSLQGQVHPASMRGCGGAICAMVCRNLKKSTELSKHTSHRQHEHEKQSPAHISNNPAPGTATFILAVLQGARAGLAPLQSFETSWIRLIKAQLNTHWL